MRAFGAVQAFIKTLVRLHKEFLEFGRVFSIRAYCRAGWAHVFKAFGLKDHHRSGLEPF